MFKILRSSTLRQMQAKLAADTSYIIDLRNQKKVLQTTNRNLQDKLSVLEELYEQTDTKLNEILYNFDTTAQVAKKSKAQIEAIVSIISNRETSYSPIQINLKNSSDSAQKILDTLQN